VRSRPCDSSDDSSSLMRPWTATDQRADRRPASESVRTDVDASPRLPNHHRCEEAPETIFNPRLRTRPPADADQRGGQLCPRPDPAPPTTRPNSGRRCHLHVHLALRMHNPKSMLGAQCLFPHRPHSGHQDAHQRGVPPNGRWLQRSRPLHRSPVRRHRRTDPGSC
jgi:hypothetical protein